MISRADHITVTGSVSGEWNTDTVKVRGDLLVEEGMIAPGDLDMLSYVDSPEDAWQAIRDFYQPACGGGHAPSGLCDLFR